MHDLHAVAVRQPPATVLLPGDDYTIQFNGNPSLVQPEPADEIGNRCARGERVRLAIDEHLHDKNIVISRYLYNVGTIW